jgi:hypothetical protein
MKYFATLNLKDYILSKKREARVSDNWKEMTLFYRYISVVVL